MKRRSIRRSAILFLFSLIVVTNGWSQAVSSARLNMNLGFQNGAYIYNYSMSNASTSTAPIVSLDLDVSQSATGAVLSNSGLVGGAGFLTDNSTAISGEASAVQTVPAVASAPTYWVATLTIDGKMCWIATKSGQVLPGGSLAGFQIVSPGLPSIRPFTAEPFLDVDTASLPEPTPDTLGQYLNSLDTLMANLSYSGLTVAPAAPPANFDAVAFLQTIQAYKEESFNQGWITDRGIANSLDQKLNVALADLQRGDRNSAQGVLYAFLQEVNAQTGKSLLPEATSVLGANVNYLIAHM
jgi:hypothetical protein